MSLAKAISDVAAIMHHSTATGMWGCLGLLMVCLFVFGLGAPAACLAAGGVCRIQFSRSRRRKNSSESAPTEIVLVSAPPVPMKGAPTFTQLAADRFVVDWSW